MSDYKPNAEQLNAISNAVKQPYGPEHYEARISLDFGGHKVAIACHVALKGRLSLSDEIKLLHIRGHQYMKDVLAFAVDENSYQTYWGDAVEVAEKEGKLEGKRKFVFQSLKICLSENRWKRGKQRRVDEELAELGNAIARDDLTVDWLMREYFELIRHDAEAAVDEYLSSWWRADSDRCLVARHWVFTVPQSSDKPANQWYIRILKAAGFPRYGKLLPEVDAVTVWRLRNQWDGPEPFKSDRVIVLDGGSLTLQGASLVTCDIVKQSGLVSLPLIDHLTKYCGSNTLNERFMSYFDADLRRVRNELSALRSSTHSSSVFDLESHIAKHFHRRKRDFDEHEEPDPIQMPREVGTIRQLQIPRAEMKAWFDDIFEEVCEVIRGLFDARYSTTLLLAGGLFQSKWLTRKVNDHFKSLGGKTVQHETDKGNGSDDCVALGAVWRMPPHAHSSIAAIDLCHAGIARHEPYRKDHHGELIGDYYRFEGRKYAPYRFKRLIRKDTWGAQEDIDQISSTAVIYTLVAKDDSPASHIFLLQEQVYCSYVDVPDHAYVDVDRLDSEDYVFHRDGPPISKEVDTSLFLWTPATRKKRYGKTIHELTVDLTVMVQDGRHEIRWDIVKPKLKPAAPRGPRSSVSVSDVGPNQLLDKDILHDRCFSAFPARSPWVAGGSVGHPLLVEDEQENFRFPSVGDEGNDPAPLVGDKKDSSVPPVEDEQGDSSPSSVEAEEEFSTPLSRDRSMTLGGPDARASTLSDDAEPTLRLQKRQRSSSAEKSSSAGRLAAEVDEAIRGLDELESNPAILNGSQRDDSESLISGGDRVGIAMNWNSPLAHRRAERPQRRSATNARSTIAMLEIEDPEEGEITRRRPKGKERQM